MGLSLNELLAADPSALRHSDWVELQRLARDEIAIDRDNLEKLKPLAARMREIDALVSGGRLLDRERLKDSLTERYRTSPERTYAGDGADIAIETVTAFAAALLAQVQTESFGIGLRAAIRAAGVEPVETCRKQCWAADVHTSLAEELRRANAEKARADKAESTLAALETVIAETSHAAGISGTMTPAQRVREMGHAMDTHKVAASTARAEADALRAEVAALRGLADNEDAHRAVRCHLVYQPAGYLITEAIRAALATVPPAKVADAVPPQCANGHRYRNGMSDSDETCCYMCGFEPPKTPTPEPAGLEREQRVDTTTEAIQRGFDALAKWGRHNSAHEGFAVLLEEIDELKAHVWMKQTKRDLAAMRSEAIDVAAVALRFADELCTEERGRR